jgi:hypothetical protein
MIFYRLAKIYIRNNFMNALNGINILQTYLFVRYLYDIKFRIDYHDGTVKMLQQKDQLHLQL